jgi:hypothetical protein
MRGHTKLARLGLNTVIKTLETQLYEECHALYKDFNRSFKVVSKYRHVLESCGIYWKGVESIFSEENIGLARVTSDTTAFRLDVSSFELTEDSAVNMEIRTACSILDTFFLHRNAIEAKYRILKVLKLIPDAMINQFIIALSREMADEIADNPGSTTMLFPFMGVIKTNNYELKRNGLDVYASVTYRKELIARGITPKNLDNPDGAEWKIYLDKSEIPVMSWRATRCTLTNHRLYKFKPTHATVQWVEFKKDLRDGYVDITDIMPHKGLHAYDKVCLRYDNDERYKAKIKL